MSRFTNDDNYDNQLSVIVIFIRHIDHEGSCLKLQIQKQWHCSLYAIVIDRLSAVKLAITPDMGHGWASDVALSNIHERYSLTLRFLLYKNKKVSIKTP